MKIFFFQFCSAELLLMMSLMAWGESFDRLLECKSKATYSSHCPVKGCSLSIPHPLSLCLFSFLPSQFCAARPCKSWWIALETSLGGSRIYSPLKFIKPIWKIYLRRTTLAEIRSVIWAAGVDRMISTNSYSFIKPAPARGYHLTTLLPFFLKMTEVADKFFLFPTLYAAFRLSSLHWNELSPSVIF